MSIKSKLAAKKSRSIKVTHDGPVPEPETQVEQPIIEEAETLSAELEETNTSLSARYAAQYEKPAPEPTAAQTEPAAPRAPRTRDTAPITLAVAKLRKDRVAGKKVAFSSRPESLKVVERDAAGLETAEAYAGMAYRVSQKDGGFIYIQGRTAIVTDEILKLVTGHLDEALIDYTVEEVSETVRKVVAA